MPAVHATISGLRAAIDRLRSEREGGPGARGRVVLVPTMGALHAGHLAIVRQARALGEIVVVSIFVNPLQFGPSEDFDRYPRTLEADVASLGDTADLVFAPGVEEMYPHGAVETRVVAGPVASQFEGASRPGHFDGMLTVVSKLFHIVGPDVAVFGRKDAQQVFLVQRMVEDLNVPVRIHVAETVRDTDGLALSSRNRFLSTEERPAAVALSSALAAAAGAGPGSGVRPMLGAAHAALARYPQVRLDYLAVVDPATFRPLDDDAGAAGPPSALMLIAARIGTTRLIDNELIPLR